MDAGSIDLVAGWHPAAGRNRVGMAAWFSYALIAALALAAILIAARRLAGGLEQPLPPVSIGLAVALASLFAAGARFALPAHPFSNRGAAFVLRWLPAVLLAIFVASLSVPRTSPAAVAIAWCIVVAEELLAWQRFRVAVPRNFAPIEPREPELPLAVSRIARPPSLAPQSIVPQPLASPALAPSLPNVSPEVVQQQTRTYLANGVDRLSGWLQMSLATSERNATAHVAFCPPFLEVPKISLRQTAGPAGRIRAVQILPHGVRLELKLDLSPRQPQRVSVEFVGETRGG